MQPFLGHHFTGTIKILTRLIILFCKLELYIVLMKLTGMIKLKTRRERGMNLGSCSKMMS